MQITRMFKPSRIADLLNGAFDIGTMSNYWVDHVDPIRPKGYTIKNSFMAEIPFLGGKIKIFTVDDEEYILDEKAVKKGLKVFLDLKYKDGSMNEYVRMFLEDNEDAISSDMFLQCCLFNEVVYG